ncbi:hypothetical protein Ahy_B05g075565 [Arachis hypogaea]|uniref:RNase H type-1 domain-containing protein n=1 Tax=Arachis hypogaea TaxID=3818 RepID=A0A444Z1F9_ARAHY|nr:hypothetical protein Ahy_B05g075565 [Arachis hypogaea]
MILSSIKQVMQAVEVLFVIIWIATANEFHHVIIELDSTMAINFVKYGCPAQHPCATLLEDIAILVCWNHIFREANSVTDILAKKGQDLPYGLHIFYAPL